MLAGRPRRRTARDGLDAAPRSARPDHPRAASRPGTDLTAAAGRSVHVCDRVPTTRYARTVDGLDIAFQVHGDGPIDRLLVPGVMVMRVRHLDPSDVTLIAHIDRSEHVDVQYAVRDGQLVEAPVFMEDIPTWPDDGGEYSITKMLDFCTPIVDGGATLLGASPTTRSRGLRSSTRPSSRRSHGSPRCTSPDRTGEPAPPRRCGRRRRASRAAPARRRCTSRQRRPDRRSASTSGRGVALPIPSTPCSSNANPRTSTSCASCGSPSRAGACGSLLLRDVLVDVHPDELLVGRLGPGRDDHSPSFGTNRSR